LEFFPRWDKPATPVPWISEGIAMPNTATWQICCRARVTKMDAQFALSKIREPFSSCEE
jgi:hypothetical protein